MAKLLEQSLEALSQTFSFILEAIKGLRLNPMLWESSNWLVLVLLLLLLYILVRALFRGPRQSNEPELLVSRGIIQQPESSPTQVLHIKISNLNEYPIQLLEMSLQSELMSAPFMVESAEIVAPHAAVELEAVLPNNIVGDKGVLELYAYLSKRQNKLYKLKTSFAWEPWAQRYKIEAVGQHLKRSKQLASTRLNQARKKAWYQYNMKSNVPVVQNEPEEPEETFVPKSKPPRQLDMDFPADF
ncbi:MAG: hypothetical protein KC422_19625 [Trueperaceae bacterium]|nr:hypothetical protein [Trueperaceae bacterium]